MLGYNYMAVHKKSVTLTSIQPLSHNLQCHIITLQGVAVGDGGWEVHNPSEEKVFSNLPHCSLNSDSPVYATNTVEPNQAEFLTFSVICDED